MTGAELVGADVVVDTTAAEAFVVYNFPCCRYMLIEWVEWVDYLAYLEY